MVEAWLIDDSSDDPRSEHLNPPQYVNMNGLYELSGVEHYRIDVADLKKNKSFENLRKERGYDWDDTCIISKKTMSNYDEMIKKFYTEHLHEDEEIRLFLEGSGYFDVRDVKDRWIRIKAEKGDMLVLPAGIYHRFTVDTNNYAKVMRLFCGTPVWRAFDRPADDHPARLKYLETVLNN